MAQSSTVTGPTHFASALVNGDDSGLTPDERLELAWWVDTFLKGGWAVVSTVEDSERFTWSYRLHGGAADGGEVVDYVVLRGGHV